MRGSPERSLGCSEHLRERVTLLSGDLLDPASLRAAVEQARPREIYHLAAPSFVPASWERPAETHAIVGRHGGAARGRARRRSAMRACSCRPRARSSARRRRAPRREDTPCRPTTPYAIAKLAAHQLVGALRAHDGLHASSGILYNHESERRPERFVTRRVTRGAAAISLGLQDELTLGSLQAVRDWSFAGDIDARRVADAPAGSARTTTSWPAAWGAPSPSLRMSAFACVGLDAERYLRVDPSLVRTPETTPSVGDPPRPARSWAGSRSVGFEELVERMVRADLRVLQAARVASARRVDCPAR